MRAPRRAASSTRAAALASFSSRSSPQRICTRPTGTITRLLLPFDPSGLGTARAPLPQRVSGSVTPGVQARVVERRGLHGGGAGARVLVRVLVRVLAGRRRD